MTLLILCKIQVRNKLFYYYCNILMWALFRVLEVVVKSHWPDRWHGARSQAQSTVSHGAVPWVASGPGPAAGTRSDTPQPTAWAQGWLLSRVWTRWLAGTRRRPLGDPRVHCNCRLPYSWRRTCKLCTLPGPLTFSPHHSQSPVVQQSDARHKTYV